MNTYTLPDFWAPALINGDYSGMSPEDDDALDAWLQDNEPGACVSVEDDSAFYWVHDASRYVLACNCSTYTFIG